MYFAPGSKDLGAICLNRKKIDRIFLPVIDFFRPCMYNICGKSRFSKEVNPKAKNVF